MKKLEQSGIESNVGLSKEVMNMNMYLSLDKVLSKIKNCERVLNYLRTKGEPVNLDIICAGIPDMSGFVILTTLRQLIISGDVLDCPPYSLDSNKKKTWKALT